MRAVITVIGKDRVGIMAHVSSICSENSVNIVDVTQSVLQEFFTMVMLVELPAGGIPCGELADKMNVLGKDMSLEIHVMHEDIFNSMHRI
ncbi:MAG: ACT domain-containing protein [Clostridia bacterium]|nr:ACT domain-containing protein [Clostridia bacterium]MDR3644209.1 ACT domain-containing protein [Clostridia bacterium]